MMTLKSSKSNTFVIIYAFLFFSCSSNYKLRCFEEEQKQIRQEPVYGYLRSSFQDSVASWTSKDIQAKRNLDNQVYELDDALICNSSRSKCIMFLLMENQAEGIKYSTKFIGCEINPDDSWNFYYRPYLVTYYSHLTEEDDPFNHMSMETKLTLISDGLINVNCKIDDNYLTSELWFSKDRKKEHENFLKDKL